MIRKMWRGQSTARIIYSSYKDSPYYTLLMLTIIFSIVLVVYSQVLVPQVESWLSIREETIATRQRIDTLKSNIAYMTMLDKDKLEKDRLTIIAALPVEKDFASIIEAVAASSVLSGVAVDDFTFGLGPISTVSAIQETEKDDLQRVHLNLTLKGNIDAVKVFVKEVGEKLPMNEVQTLTSSKTASTMTMVFYSKVFRALNIIGDQPIETISSENTALLETLSVWANAVYRDKLQEIPERSSKIPIF